MKKATTILAAAVMALQACACTIPATAATPNDGIGIVTPCYDYTNYSYSRISISSSNVATCTSVVQADEDADRIYVTQYLQMRDGLQWRTVGTWTRLYKGNYCSFTNTQDVPSGSTYRTHTVAKVYASNGVDYELVYTYSAEAP